LLAGAPAAQAIESVTIQYQSEELELTFDELESFIDGTDIPELREFIDANTARSTDELQSAADSILSAIRTSLSYELFISDRLQNDLEKFLDSTTGEFVLVQLERVISSASNDLQNDLAALETAMNRSLSDNNISVIELIRRYPEDAVRIDADKLEGTVNDVTAFVERIEPALQVVGDVLRDIVCDCDEPVATSGSATEVAATCNSDDRAIVAGESGESGESDATTAATTAATTDMEEDARLAATTESGDR